MLSFLNARLTELISLSLKDFFPPGQQPPVEIDIPQEKDHGDFSCNVALKSARLLKKSPLEIAQQFTQAILRQLDHHPLKGKIARIEAVKPGFINFHLSLESVQDILRDILKNEEDFGKTVLGKGQKVLLEFVSANPTGPLSIAHARQAAVGDALANILKFSGFKVQKEYYVNDEGNQINILGRSIECRARQAWGGGGEFPADFYQGEYIVDMAKEFLARQGITTLAQLDKRSEEDFRQFGLDYLLRVIEKELDDFGVHFDVWAYQSKIATAQRMEKLLAEFQKEGVVYEKDGALWFRSTAWGDDKDRVVKKSDGAYTYLTPDIVYHKDKFSRGFECVVNIWGPDHHGYIPRLRAAVQALGKKPEALQVLIVQLATIYREGKPISMSTRRGQYISLREVMDEVGVDAARYFFLMRHINAHLDFDLELAKKETPENPVFYIQYAHARIHSIVQKAKEAGLAVERKDLSLLREEEEITLIKQMGSFPKILEICAQEWDPFALVSYLLELATAFHRFYDKHRVVDPANKPLSRQRLGLIEAVRIVLANGLRVLGISRPEKM